MYRILILFAFFALSSEAIQLNNRTDDVLDLINKAGYRGTAYQVKTEDNGWNLIMHRIFPKRKVPGTMPVFLMHGLFTGSFDWLITGRNKALGYLLADNNFDVFMGNSRGNKNAGVDFRRANQSTLWDFSFNEIGCYDVAAMIDYALNVTNAKKLFYVGHSQGTVSLMALLSSRPEYNSKIIQAHLFAPAVFMKHLPNPWIKTTGLTLMEYLQRQDIKILNFTDVFTVSNPFSKIFCNQGLSPQTTEICKAIIFSIAGSNPEGEEIDNEILPHLIDHIAWTLSSQQVNHFSQGYLSGKFRKYDYGLRNKQIYGSAEPPEYDLSKVTAPIYIYRATEDLLSSRRDVEHLKELLPNVKHYRVIPNYSHVDFNFGRRSRKLIFNDVIKFFQSEGLKHP